MNNRHHNRRNTHLMKRTRHMILLSCHGCGHCHKHWPQQLLIDPSLTVYYRCPDLGEGFHHTLGTGHASAVLAAGVPISGVPDTIETIEQ